MLRRLGITLFFLATASVQLGCSLKANVVDKNSIGTGDDSLIPSINLVTSKHKFSVVGQFSYVDLAVDWDRRLAYLASRKGNACVDVIDFSNIQEPILIGSIGSASFQQCVGVKLFDNNSKLVISSSVSKKVAVWSLGSDPSFSAGWFKMGDVSLGSVGGKRLGDIVQTADNTYEFLNTVDNGVKLVSMVVSSHIATLSVVDTFSSAKSQNSAVSFGGEILLQSFDGTASVVSHLNSNLLYQNEDVTGFWGWTALANADGSKAFLGGSGGVFYEYNGVGTSLKHRFKLPFGVIRGASFAQVGGEEFLVTANSSGLIDLYDVNDMANITRIKSGKINVFDGEVYSILVEPDSSVAVAVTNQGDFLVLDLDGLNDVEEQFPGDL